VTPGAKVKLPFVFDFASSAAELPIFKLALASKLPGAGLSLSGTSFSRGPTDKTTNRASPTTRNAIVRVPADAALGSYELALSATAGRGGTVNAATTMVVKPAGTAGIGVPKRVGTRVAWTRGVPVELKAPIAGTRFRVVLEGPRPSGRGRMRLLRRVRVARELGTANVRFRLPRAQAEAFLALGAALWVKAKVGVPGAKKPLRLVRSLTLR
jgi:hypothetical protein